MSFERLHNRWDPMSATCEKLLPEDHNLMLNVNAYVNAGIQFNAPYATVVQAEDIQADAQTATIERNTLQQTILNLKAYLSNEGVVLPDRCPSPEKLMSYGVSKLLDERGSILYESLQTEGNISGEKENLCGQITADLTYILSHPKVTREQRVAIGKQIFENDKDPELSGLRPRSTPDLFPLVKVGIDATIEAAQRGAQLGI